MHVNTHNDEGIKVSKYSREGGGEGLSGVGGVVRVLGGGGLEADEAGSE